MDLSFTPAEEGFRAEVRAFIHEAMPADIADKARRYARFNHADTTRWHEVLHQRGWGAITWPVEHGGPDLSATERYILLGRDAAAHGRGGSGREAPRAR